MATRDELSAAPDRSPGWMFPGYWSVRMTPFSNLTSRNLLIVIHDALATTAALLASFYLRFEGDSFFDRLPLLLRILPYFIALSVVVCYMFNLTTTKRRFFSLPDALNILRAATVLTLALLVMDYIFVAPNIHGAPVAPNMQGAFFLGKITIILYRSEEHTSELQSRF